MMLVLVLVTQLALPQALVTARTVTVVNEGVNQDFYESVVKEIQQTKRFSLAENGDVVLAVSSSRGIGRNVIGVVPATYYQLTVRKDQTVLYSDQFQGCCSIKSMIHKTIEKMVKRLEDHEMR